MLRGAQRRVGPGCGGCCGAGLRDCRGYSGGGSDPFGLLRSELPHRTVMGGGFW